MKKNCIIIFLVFVLLGCESKTTNTTSELTLYANTNKFSYVANNETNLFIYSGTNPNNSYLRLVLPLEELPDNIAIKTSNDGKALGICKTGGSNDICFKYFILGDKSSVPENATILKTYLNQVIYSYSSSLESFNSDDEEFQYFYSLNYENLVSFVSDLAENKLEELYLNDQEKYVSSLNNKFKIVFSDQLTLYYIVFRSNNTEDVIYMNYENIYSNTFITLAVFRYFEDETSSFVNTEYPEDAESFIYKEDLDNYYALTEYLDAVYIELIEQ